MALKLTALDLDLERLDIWYPSLDAMEPSLDDPFPAWRIGGTAPAATGGAGKFTLGKALSFHGVAMTGSRSAYYYVFTPRPAAALARTGGRGVIRRAGYGWRTRAM